jgi:hypothetical protein
MRWPRSRATGSGPKISYLTVSVLEGTSHKSLELKAWDAWYPVSEIR